MTEDTDAMEISTRHVTVEYTDQEEDTQGMMFSFRVICRKAK